MSPKQGIVPRALPVRYTYKRLLFSWRGGAYIDVHFLGVPLDVINVYDYAKGEVDLQGKSWRVWCREYADELSEHDRAGFEELAVMYR